MSQAPYMPVFTDALLGDTLHLSTEEFGAYLLLLFATWRNNGAALPDDPQKMAHVCRCSASRWNRALRPVLVTFFSLDEMGCWHQKRLEKEWVFVKNRRERSRANGSRGGRPKPREKKETDKATGSVQDNPNGNPDGNLNESTHTQVRKKDLALKKLNPHFLTARESSPPLPSRGDGVAASRSPDSPPTVFDDPALKADVIANFDRCLDALKGKLGLFEADATVVPPPDPRLIAFRDRKQRINTFVGERLRGDERMRGWELIARVDEFADPDTVPPPLMAQLAALESLVVHAEAAE